MPEKREKTLGELLRDPDCPEKTKAIERLEQRKRDKLESLCIWFGGGQDGKQFIFDKNGVREIFPGDPCWK